MEFYQKMNCKILHWILLSSFAVSTTGCSFFYYKIAGLMGLEPQVVESITGYAGKAKQLGQYMETCQTNGGSIETCAAPGLLMKKCVGDKEQGACDRFQDIMESGKPDEKLAQFTKHMKSSLLSKGSSEFLGLEISPHFDKEPKGFLIGEVKEGSVWEKSGAKTGEVLISIDGHPVTSAENLFKVVSDLVENPRDTVDIKTVPLPK